MKHCKKCNTDKSETEFYVNNATADKLFNYCKICTKKSQAEYDKANPERKRIRDKNRRLKKTNGDTITLDIYNNMVELQDNKCGICHIEMKTPYVDHDHETGKTRMLLCHHCNTLLGMAKENIAILNNAIKYLETYNPVS